MATKAVQNGRSPVDKQKQRNDKAEESYPTGVVSLFSLEIKVKAHRRFTPITEELIYRNTPKPSLQGLAA